MAPLNYQSVWGPRCWSADIAWVTGFRSSPWQTLQQTLPFWHPDPALGLSMSTTPGPRAREMAELLMNSDIDRLILQSRLAGRTHAADRARS